MFLFRWLMLIFVFRIQCQEVNDDVLVQDTVSGG